MDHGVRIHSDTEAKSNLARLQYPHPLEPLLPSKSELAIPAASLPRPRPNALSSSTFPRSFDATVVSGHLDNSTPICGTRSPSPEMDAAGNSPWKIILPPSFLRLFAQGRCFGGKAISQRDVDSFRSNWARLGRKFFDDL